MTPIDYDGRTFAAVENAANGDVDAGTRFHYRQAGDLVWADYAGGGCAGATCRAAWRRTAISPSATTTSATTAG